MNTAKWFMSSGVLNVTGLFGSAAGVIPVESGLHMGVLGAACFLIASVSALWNARK